MRVTNILARQLYAAGDSLLERATPVALTTNDLYCITKRLKLPLDSTAQTGIYNSYEQVYVTGVDRFDPQGV